ncbi:hypothetical protein GQ55_3G486200 [Panicum hallii var. hallii]|uniref:Uncharacterized protein n=1 Tax=Panicum hallii var. hallii TaxID=1504633 RepID=A0A2T7EJP7_9POAL|nr:hypothetical protein GQ55_3G486200 [Panicum hallii var. hallii]
MNLRRRRTNGVYGSIGELLAHLELNLDPADLFDVHAKLPHWLHHAKDNELIKVDAHTAPDPNFAAAVGSFWVKVSSAAAFRRALADLGLPIRGNALPAVFLFMLPTIPLRAMLTASRDATWSREAPRAGGYHHRQPPGFEEQSFRLQECRRAAHRHQQDKRSGGIAIS